jgi:hypothetical protein
MPKPEILYQLRAGRNKTGHPKAAGRSQLKEVWTNHTPLTWNRTGPLRDPIEVILRWQPVHPASHPTIRHGRPDKGEGRPRRNYEQA